MKWLVRVTVLILVAALTYGAREAKHWLHYRQVESEGNLRARLVRVEIPGLSEPEETLTCRVVVENLGTEPWGGVESRTTLGLCGRDTIGRRRLLPFTVIGGPAMDRVVVPMNQINIGQSWSGEFQLVAPTQPGHYVIHLQMVKEGVTWFGEEKNVIVTVEQPRGAN